MISNLDYQTDSEELALKFLQECGVQCHRNNIEDKLAVDLYTEDNIKIDVQYSNNYEKYGDFRLDIVSIYTPKNVTPNPNYRYNPNKNFIYNFKEKYNCNIMKNGKFFQKDYLDYFIILFYKQKYTNQVPDFVLLISKKDLIDYCKPRVPYLFNRIKTNNKQTGFNDIGLKDNYGSAFIPLNVHDLCKNTNCIFGSYNDLLTKKEQVQQYLSH